MFLPNDPSEVGLDPVEAKKAPAAGAPATSGGSIGFVQALKIPNVMGYALAFGFFKFINYAMFFWLPFFLSLHFDSESANVVSSLYSVGMMPGGVIVGVVSDLYDGRRACVIATFMCILAPLLWMFAMYSDVMNPILLLFMLGVMGILVGGPNNIITSAVAADLAEHPSIGGNTRSLGTVTGIINGSGSITAAFGLMVIGPLQSLGGWTAVWYFLIACTIMGTGLMSPKIWKELTDHQVN
jgi:sugar phosphate permease